MNMKVRLHEADQSFSPKLDDGKAKRFTANFSDTTIVTVQEKAEYYDGEYEITPTVDAQTLPVAEKTMREDLTVKEIPVYDVSNTAGGTTFYIATMNEEPDGGRAIVGKMKLGTAVL